MTRCPWTCPVCGKQCGGIENHSGDHQCPKCYKVPEGWAWPLNARKAHYFVGRKSLCGKWIFFGRLQDDDGKDGPMDCKACTRKLRGKK